MTEITVEILSSWILSGYKFIICTQDNYSVKLHPIFQEVELDFENSYLLPINDEMLIRIAEGRFMLLKDFQFLCDASDIE